MGNAACGGGKPRTYAVTLHVYRLMSGPPSLAVMESTGYGVYHTGVEVDGVEYAFGGGDFSTTGVWEQRPTRLPQSFAGATLKESIILGSTVQTPRHLRGIIATMKREWLASNYNLLSRNCNHFSAALCEALGVPGPPQYVNRLANAGEQVAKVASGVVSMLCGMLDAGATAAASAAATATAATEQQRWPTGPNDAPG